MFLDLLLSKLLLWLVFSSHIQWPFRTSTPSQREIFSHSCYCGLFIWSFLSGPTQPPKMKYSLKSCYCVLFIWSLISGPAHPPKVKYSLKAVILACSVCSYVCFGLSGPAHPPKEKYSLKAIFVACSLCSYVCFGLPGPAHPPKEKYFLKLLLWLALSARMYVLAFHNKHTLPKWNILSSCYCDLLSLLICMYFPSRTSTLSQSEIFSDSCYYGLFAWNFLSGPEHPLKVKYSFKAVIVACRLSSYTVAYQDQYTLPKRNILSPSHYCGLLSLLVYSGLSGPAHPPKVKYSLKLLLWLALSASMYVLASQDQHTLPKWNILSSCYCDFLSLLIGIYWP